MNLRVSAELGEWLWIVRGDAFEVRASPTAGAVLGEVGLDVLGEADADATTEAVGSPLVPFEPELHKMTVTCGDLSRILGGPFVAESAHLIIR